MPQALPANPNLDWLKKAAKKRLAELRSTAPDTRLHQAQFLIAQDHGFPSWRALKAHIDALSPDLSGRESVFAAARAGDVDAVRRALASGFDPATPDRDGRTIYQIGKELGYDAVEILARDVQTGPRTRPDADEQAIRAIATAAQSGDAGALGTALDARPDLIDALAGGGLQRASALHLAVLRNRHDAIRLLIARGADLDRRDFPDNATPLHFAALHGDMQTIRLLVEAGADVDGRGDDYAVGVLGWATCFNQVREDVAAYLIAHGAKLKVWTAIALDRIDELRAMISADPSLLTGRMSRNQHRRGPLHHAAAKNRVRAVELLLARGADPNARDAAGETALMTASQEGADEAVIAALLGAGAELDFLSAVNLGRYEAAEAMLRENPARISMDGDDTVALHLAVSKNNTATVRWLLAHGVAVNAKRMMWGCNHTALHMTVERGTVELAQLLLAAGADPNIRDEKFGSTALGWAEYFGRAELAAMIRDRGSQIAAGPLRATAASAPPPLAAGYPTGP
jgi:ankyrin repeat protein